MIEETGLSALQPTEIKTEELNFGIGMTNEIPIVKTYKETEIEIELNSKSIDKMKEELEGEWERFKEIVEEVMEEYSITGGEDNETITKNTSSLL